ncbi:MAG: deoxyribonuclease V [Gammaproteobacteria bacterium]|nr:MAG: deoxyribonuclease V [Gammaproteobacteria bacterium]
MARNQRQSGFPELRHRHPWDVSPKEAIAIQQRLCRFIRTDQRCPEPATVAGIDVGFEDEGRVTRAAVAVLEFPSLQPLETAIANIETRFPYIPGLLSFREIPAVLAAMDKLQQTPDLLLCDGQGFAHPRRFGLACHLGLWLGLPAIGVAKTRLVGVHGKLPVRKGVWTPLLDGEEVLGAVLCTRTWVKPVYVSAGHRITLEQSIHYVLACTTRYRLPETTRLAHRLASAA